MKLKSISGALAFAGVAVAGLAAANTAQAQATLAQIKQRGAMNCGVDTGLAGFAFKDEKGRGAASTSTTAAPSPPPF